MSLLPPEPIRSSYAAWRWSVAWEWPDIATTWRLAPAEPGPVRFLKVVRSGHHPSALDEGARMRWVHAYLPVPEVIDQGTDGTVDWLLTAALAGIDASRHPLKSDPARLVPILARALLAFHDAAPVAACPYDFRAARVIQHAQHRVRIGIATARDLHPEHAHLTIDDALVELERLAPESEDENLVVCHGDFCFPNVLLDADGRVTGYVDLGEVAVADRWWDVAVAAWSTTWNVGPGWENLFYESYGIEPDPHAIVFNRLLYDLSS